MMERKKGWKRYAVVIITTILLLLIFFFLNLFLGSASVAPSATLRALLTGKGSTEEINIIREIRMPRTFLAGILGGALALSGFLLQTYFENPIAGPFILGISSGAKMMVAFVMVAAMEAFGSISSLGMIGAAFLGAVLVTLVILAISRRISGMATLLVAGIMVGYICSAITDFVVTFADDSDIVNLHNWSQGSFSGASWKEVEISAAVVLICSLAAFFLSKPISALQLGEHYAESMGLDVRRFRVLLILISSVLSACVAAFAGPVSFVGVAVPYLCRRSLGTSKPIVVIPEVFLGGALFCTFSDLIARTVLAPTELNISTVTAIFGAPVVIFMMLRRKQ